MREIYTPKQKALLSLWKKRQLKRLNILQGSVRSGKTWISLVLWAFWVASMPKNGTYLMVAKTLTSLRRNCLDLLQALVGERHFTYSLSQKEGTLFGRKVYLEGVNDARAEGKIRGMTLTGAYCDELTLFTEDFFSMLLSRLSDPGAKLIGTTNPDHPSHWLKEKYLDREAELDLLVMQFLLDDNTFLDAAYVQNLKKEYTGVFYKRFILGLWVAADGVIYPQFADHAERYLLRFTKEEERWTFAQDVAFLSIGIDFGGNRSLTTFVATAVHRGFRKLTALRDHHIIGHKGEIDSDRVNREFVSFVTQLQTEYPGIAIRYGFADNESQYLITGLRKACRKARLPIQIGDSCKRPIVDRIHCGNALFNTDRLQIHEDCHLLIDGLKAAVWDSKAAQQGKDVRLDNFSSDIDILDGWEYGWEPFLKKLLPEYKGVRG